MTALVVPPEHDDLLWTQQLHGQNEEENLDREVPPVDVVPQEHVLCGLAVASDICFQQFEKVVELSMNISHDGNRVLDRYQVGFSL